MSMYRAIRLSVMAAASMVAACDADRTDDGSARCVECEIVLERVGILNDAFDPGALPDRMAYADRDAAGRILTIARGGSSVLVLDASGNFVARLGGPGEGPGEFRTIRRALIGPGDSIHVHDWGTGRVTVYGPDLRLARMQRMAHLPSLVLPDGAYVVIADPLQTAGNFGHVVRIIGPDGFMLRSFGTDSPAYGANTDMLATRWVAQAREGDIWTAAPGRYTLVRWDPSTGERVQEVVVESDWFQETASWPADERTRPPPVIESIWQDNDLLWVVLRDADLDWEPPPPVLANVERVMHAEEYEQEYDWVIEAIDPDDGSVIASHRFRYILWTRPPSNVLVSFREATVAGTTYDVWRPVLRERGRR
jgi:hypothetical protein